MIRALLRKGDGTAAGRGWLDSVVLHLQQGLIQAGHPMGADGLFGGTTERLLGEFRRARGLPAGGVADRPVWEALSPHLEAALGALQREAAQLLPGFAGDLEWVHARESHHGSPYWPKGNSGVTLDPGFDLGHADPFSDPFAWSVFR
ncbi:MAG: peptidoglycan-binding protein, partial [Nitrospinota bacterium]